MSAAPVGREVAHRLFAAEFDAASLSYSESDEERAPNYVVTPTGARVNRMFAVGVLTEIDTVNEDQLRARIVDPTGAFVVYAGQYQPEALTFLENASVPTFVAVTGKARTFEPEDSDRVYTSIRPESISEVDAETRERWTVTTAERTLERIATFAGALELEARGDDLRAQLAAQGVRESLAAGIPKAIEHYGTSPAYLAAMETLAEQALSVVTGDRESVPAFDAEPSMAGPETPTRVASFEAVETAADATTGSAAAVEAEVEAELEANGDVEEPVEAESAELSAVETDEPATADSPPEETEPVVESEPAIDAEAPEEDATGTIPDAEPVDAADAPATAQAEPDDDVDDALGESAGDAVVAPDTTETDEDLADFEPGEFDEMYEMDDEERKQVEEEFGTEFSTGSEVGPAGEADIDVPDPEDVEAKAPSEPEAKPEAETADDEADADEQTDGDLDVEAAVLSAMRDLDDGDGADREAVIAAVVDEHGVAVDTVEDAIQEALMDGQCYEPDESTLTAI